MTVKVKVVKGTGCCGANARPVRPQAGGLPRLPNVPELAHPPAAALPDLVPLPSWGISTSHTKATKTRVAADHLDFGATVWVGGNSPLDVEGFRSHGSPIMKAYQYYWRNGRVVGRTRAVPQVTGRSGAGLARPQPGRLSRRTLRQTGLSWCLAFSR